MTFTDYSEIGSNAISSGASRNGTLYEDTATEVRRTMTRTAESWTNGFQRMLAQVPGLEFGAIDLRLAVEGYFDDTQRIFEINRDYLKNVTAMVVAGRQAMLDYSKSMTEVMRHQVEAGVEAVREQTGKLQDVQRLQTEQVRRAGQHRVEQEDEEDRAQVTDRYRDLTKAELAEKLSERNLPRTGTVEELRQRLAEADLQVA